MSDDSAPPLANPAIVRTQLRLIRFKIGDRFNLTVKDPFDIERYRDLLREFQSHVASYICGNIKPGLLGEDLREGGKALVIIYKYVDPYSILCCFVQRTSEPATLGRH